MREERSGPGRVAIGLALVLGSYAAVRSGHADVLDGAAARLRRPLGPTADRVIAAGTDAGSVYGLAGAAGLLALTGRRSAALDVAGAGGLAWILAQASKRALDRERPYEGVDGAVDRLVAVPAGTSWPSGHSAVAAAIGTAAAAHGGTAAGVAGVALTTLVGASRVYVGVHHATDVVAGAGVGLISASLWRRLRRLASRGA